LVDLVKIIAPVSNCQGWFSLTAIFCKWARPKMGKIEKIWLFKNILSWPKEWLWLSSLAGSSCNSLLVKVTTALFCLLTFRMIFLYFLGWNIEMASLLMENHTLCVRQAFSIGATPHRFMSDASRRYNCFVNFGILTSM
jgi:hypothetical protein